MQNITARFFSPLLNPLRVKIIQSNISNNYKKLPLQTDTFCYGTRLRTVTYCLQKCCMLALTPSRS